MHVGENIRKRRTRAKLTRKALGERVGVTALTVYRWETARRCPSSALLMRIAEALKVSPATLLRGCSAQ